MKDLLFEPIQIRDLEVKNRIYMPAMHMNMAQDYLVTDTLVNFYAERARGGTGLAARRPGKLPTRDLSTGVR